MAKRTRIIEGTWNCTSCDAKDILARHKRCPTCNNPRELSGDESDFDFGDVDAQSGKSLREGVTDDKALELAGAGEDWFCAFCGAANRGDQPRCKHCGAERSADAKAAPLQAFDTPERKPPAAPPPETKPRFTKKWLWLGVLFSCCFSSGLYAMWARTPHDFPGEITGTSWKVAVTQERFTAVQKTGWADELRRSSARMPVNGAGEVAGVDNVRDCVERQRGTRKVADGTERVCRSKTRRVACGTEEKCRRRDKGNGFVEEVCEDITKYCNERYEDCQNETRYRNEPVYARQCAYDTYEWKPVDRREATGQDGNPAWPTLQPGATDRQHRSEEYTVHIRYEDDGVKETVLMPKTERDFLRWKKGQGVVVTVTNSGDLKQVVPR
ncbi:hypothetical protein HUA74_32520 [Myxococcus sp. CA051A]|uniref:hypothetical protein n=1 Tax=unclassified Myxococcus TaxID=2648731 RepID=UPI00157B0231|nr:MULTISPECIES: hypothetical protein [unclassified Myxococcus]NTX38364.1 hypothetical protein [Myxococcus sp. CA033]NTX65393.1 hypothetical protein [Myxococcus sp. CA051A]